MIKMEITRPSIIRLARQAGVKSVAEDCYPLIRALINQRLNDVIDNSFPMSKEINIKPFIKESENTKIASALGNSWCNLISYKIMRLIENKELKSKYTFLHIPSSFNSDFAVEIIDRLTE
jgi:hypothetical protein